MKRKIDHGFKVTYDKQSDLLTIHRSNGYLVANLTIFKETFKPKKRTAIMRKWSRGN